MIALPNYVIVQLTPKEHSIIIDPSKPLNGQFVDCEIIDCGRYIYIENFELATPFKVGDKCLVKYYGGEDFKVDKNQYMQVQYNELIIL